MHEAIAELRGQLAALMNLVGNGNGVKMFEAEQTTRRLKVVYQRKLRHMKLAAAYARLGLYAELMEQLRDAARTDHDAAVTKVMAEFNADIAELRKELTCAAR